MRKFQLFITENSFLIGLSFVAFSIIGYLLNFIGHPSSNNSDWGDFGSYLEGITSPFIGIIGIVLTYNILNNQNKESRQSEFKNMFQILFDSLEEKKDLISIKKGRKTYTNKQAIKFINNDLNKLITYLKKKDNSRKIEDIVYEAFWSVFDDIDGSSAIYMKNMHNCLKIIDNYCINTHKITYAHLLRAQMDSDEMVFLLYNGVASSDFKNFKNRIEKYTMLQDIKHIKTIDLEVKKLYDNKAFEEK